MGRKSRVTLSKELRPTKKLRTIRIEPVGKEDPGFDVCVDLRRGRSGFDPAKNVVDALVQRLPRIDAQIPIRKLVSQTEPAERTRAGDRSRDPDRQVRTSGCPLSPSSRARHGGRPSRAE